MILHYFKKKENKDKKIANNIYLSIIVFLQEIFNNKDLKIKKDFNSSFELTAILLSCIFFAYKKDLKNKHINQYLMDLYIFDIDKSLRDLGIGDNSIGKYVKLYVKKFYYRIFKLEKIFTSNNYEKFEKYIENIKIHNQLNDIKYLHAQ